MRRLMTRALAALLPALLVSALTIGCSGSNTGGGEGGAGGGDTGGKKERADKGKKKQLEELASTGWGTLTGKVTLEGAAPDLAAKDADIKKAMEANQQDGKFCLSGPPDEINQQQWRIGKDKGVQYVFVWLQPPQGKFFKVDMNKKTWKDEVVIDQPHCAFKPHAVVLFPGAPDPAKPSELKPSGQKFVVKNSAPMNHNTAWKGGVNAGDNKIIKSKDSLTVELQPDPDPVMIHCDIHKWMDAVARVFDHPYAAVTNEDGSYKIENVPAGVELNIVVWHEAGGYGPGGKAGEKKTLQAGENSYNATIKAQ
jgi:hypothetical protein